MDHGTNYQVLMFLGERPTSLSVRRAFVKCWVKTLGAPDIIITDPGTEFDGEFQRLVEQLGCLRDATNPECPWENGRCERRGGLAKEALAKALTLIEIETPEELAELMDATISANNRFYNRGGYAPYQLVRTAASSSSVATIRRPVWRGRTAGHGGRWLRRQRCGHVSDGTPDS